MMYTEFFIFNAFQERCSVVWDDDRKCAILDPGFYTGREKDTLFDFIREKGLEPVCIMLTHAHFDHVAGMAQTAREFGIPVYMDKADNVILEVADVELCESFGFKLPEGCGTPAKDIEYIYIKEGDTVQAGSLEFEVISTPGHTPGGVCYLEKNEKLLFSGDTLFAGAIGRTDNRWGDYDALIGGILGKLTTLNGDIDVVPGHGPLTSIAKEGMTNPFLQPFNEPYEEDI